MNHNRSYALIAILVMMISCSSSRLGWQPEKDAAKGSRIVLVEDFDPMTLHDDDIMVAPIHAPATGTETGAKEPAAADDAIPQEKMEGYRVQLLATKDEGLAREQMRKAMVIFEQKIYLEFEAPYYKLRLGDFTTRKEAEEYKETVVRMGFREDVTEWQAAWIVPSKIVVK